MPISTNVVSSNPVHGEVYSIQHYVIKFVRHATGRWFSPGTPVSSTNKTDPHGIAAILLKVVLSTIQRPVNLLFAMLLEVVFLIYTFFSSFRVELC